MIHHSRTTRQDVCLWISSCLLVLEHEGGKIFVRKDNKFALYNADGDAIASGSTRSLGNAVKDACEILIDDWYEPEQER